MSQQGFDGTIDRRIGHREAGGRWLPKLKGREQRLKKRCSHPAGGRRRNDSLGISSIPNVSKVSGERAGARTQDQRLKRAMLYRLSYPLAQA
jgi:hypothetical protein